MTSETATQESVAQVPAPVNTLTKKTTSKKPAKKKSAPKKAAPKKKTAKKRVVKKPVAAKKSVAKKSTTKKAAPKKRKAKKQPVPTVTKAQAIRDMGKELGKKARPRDIIAALAENGITVTSPQVTQTLKAAGLRRGRKKAKSVVVATKHSANGHGLDLAELLKVKKLAEEIGGTAKVRELAAALERLM